MYDFIHLTLQCLFRLYFNYVKYCRTRTASGPEKRTSYVVSAPHQLGFNLVYSVIDVQPAKTKHKIHHTASVHSYLTKAVLVKMTWESFLWGQQWKYWSIPRNQRGRLVWSCCTLTWPRSAKASHTSSDSSSVEERELPAAHTPVASPRTNSSAIKKNQVCTGSVFRAYHCLQQSFS